MPELAAQEAQLRRIARSLGSRKSADEKMRFEEWQPWWNVMFTMLEC